MGKKRTEKKTIKAATYAEALKALREKMGTPTVSKDFLSGKETRGVCPISQVELARLLGVSYSALTKWEQGVREPMGLYRETVDKFLKRYGIEIGS